MRRAVIGFFATVLLAASCGADRSPLAGEPISRSLLASIEAESGGLDALVDATSSVVSFRRVDFVGQVETGTEQNPPILNNRFVLAGVNLVAGAKVPSGDLAVFESTGRHHRESVFNNCCSSETTYALLEQEERPLSTGESLHVPAAFIVGKSGAVTFLGPSGPRFTAELAAFVNDLMLRGSSLPTDALTIVRSLVDRSSVRGRDTRAALTEWETRRSTPPAWDEQPSSERPLDPELTPPDVLSTLRSISVEVSSRIALDRSPLRVQSRSGVSLVVVLDTLTTTALVDPDSPLTISIDGVKTPAATTVVSVDDATTADVLRISIDEKKISATWVSSSDSSGTPSTAVRHEGGTDGP
jgi:hypothetical protein